jgi:hypothetical protein
VVLCVLRDRGGLTVPGIAPVRLLRRSRGEQTEEARLCGQRRPLRFSR